jgi:hypothetical protein
MTSGNLIASWMKNTGMLLRDNQRLQKDHQRGQQADGATKNFGRAADDIAEFFRHLGAQQPRFRLQKRGHLLGKIADKRRNAG